MCGIWSVGVCLYLYVCLPEGRWHSFIYWVLNLTIDTNEVTGKDKICLSTDSVWSAQGQRVGPHSQIAFTAGWTQDEDLTTKLGKLYLSAIGQRNHGHFIQSRRNVVGTNSQAISLQWCVYSGKGGS